MYTGSERRRHAAISRSISPAALSAVSVACAAVMEANMEANTSYDTSSSAAPLPAVWRRGQSSSSEWCITRSRAAIAPVGGQQVTTTSGTRSLKAPATALRAESSPTP